MKLTSIYLWGIGLGVFALTVGLLGALPWVAIAGAAGAYGSAGAYRYVTRKTRRTRKGARK